MALGCAGGSREAKVPARRPSSSAPAPPPGSPTPAPVTAPVDVAQELVLARVAHVEGRVQDESAHLERIVQAAPGAFGARVDLAELLLQQGTELGRAGRLLGEAGALRPDDARVDRLHGWLDELQGDDAHAIFRYGRVLLVNPDPELRLRRAVLLERTGLQDEALEEFQRVVKERPADRAARAGIAEIDESRGRLADAEAALVQITQLAPTEPGPLHRLAAFYRRHGEPARALEAERRARSLEGAPRALRPLRPSRQ